MIEFKHEDYKIGLCLDIEEWAKEFYGMPEGAIIDNVEEIQRECMGFSDIAGKELWIFLPKKYEPEEFEATIAHEVGHTIDLKHTVNPEQIEENDELHELKANYYEGYYMTVRRIVDKANRALAEHLHENAVLHLADVSQQRELLLAYETFKQQPKWDGAYNADEFIEMFLANNCG